MRKSGVKPNKIKKILYYPKKGYKNAIRILRMLAKEDTLSTKQIGISLSERGDFSHKQIKNKMEDLTMLGYCEEYKTVRNSEHMCENCNESSRYIINASQLELDIETMKNWPASKQREGHVIGQLLSFDCFNCRKEVEPHKEEYYKIQQDRLWSLSSNGKVVMLGLLTGEKLYKFVKKQTCIKEFQLINAIFYSDRKDLTDRLILLIKKNMDIDPNVIKFLNLWYDEVKPVILNLKVDKNKHPELASFQKNNQFNLQ